MEFLNSLPAPSEQEIIHFELKLGNSLPIPYRNFLLTHNGARPAFEAISVPKWGNTLLRHFIPLSSQHAYSLDYYLRTFNNRIPQAFIPLIPDGAGNLFLLGISGKYTGQVWFWYHESDDGEKPTFKNMYKVAPDFPAFIKLIHAHIEPEETLSTEELLATQGGISAFKKWLAQGNDINAPLIFNEPLMLRVILRKPPALDELTWLVKNGASLQGSLHKAMNLKNLSVIAHLIDLGAPINEPDQKGNTVLERSIIAESPEIALFFLQKGADPRHCDARGMDALSIVETKLRLKHISLLPVQEAIQTFLHQTAGLPFWETEGTFPSLPNLESLEAHWQITLPTDYRNFLLTTNGGIPHPCLYQTIDRGPIWIQMLYGLSPTDPSFPASPLNGWLEVGLDRQGNKVQLGIADEQRGHIRLAICPKRSQTNAMEHFIPLAFSFSEFIHQFQRSEGFPRAEDILKNPTAAGLINLLRHGWTMDGYAGRTSLAAIFLKAEAQEPGIFEIALQADLPSTNLWGEVILAQNLKAAHLLVEYGYDIEEWQGKNFPPLAFAAKSKAAHIALWLLANGANPTIADFKGKTALDYAQEWVEKGESIMQPVLEALQKPKE